MLYTLTLHNVVRLLCLNKAGTLERKEEKKKRMSPCCHFKNLYMDVYSNFIHKWQNLEATKMSLNRGMDKLWYLWIMEYYSVLRRNELSSHEKTLRNLKCSTK